MKKIILLSIFSSLLIFSVAQNQTIHVDDMLYKHFGAQQVEKWRADNPKQLVIENYNLVGYCFLAMKMTEEEGTYQIKGELKNVVKPGVDCDYNQIVRNGCINRYDFNLEQDPFKQNVYTLGETGAYLIVLSKATFDNNLNAALREYGLY